LGLAFRQEISLSFVWIGHLVRMDLGKAVEKIFESKRESRRRMERSRLRWLENVEKDLR
jgi:hypothetical protein